MTIIAKPQDGAENAGYSCPIVGQPVNVTNGNMWLQQTDFSLPGIGEQIEIKRFYNSIIQTSGIFGRGWSTKYDESLQFYGNNLIRLNMPDGRAVYFTREGTTGSFLPHTPEMYGFIDKNTVDGSYTLTFKNGLKHHFNAIGILQWQKDRNGNQTTLHYDQNNVLTHITDANGNTLTINIVDALVQSISHNSVTIATYIYWDGTPNLKEITYQDGSKYKFTYNTTAVSGKTFLETVKDANDKILETHQYDGSGRATTSEKEGGVEKYIFDYSNWGLSQPYTLVKHKKNASDPNFIETKYFFDKSKGKNFISKTEGNCNCGGGTEFTTFEYDDRLNLTKKRERISTNVWRDTTFTYNYQGDVTAMTDTWGTQKFTYNPYGQVLTYKDRVDSQNTTNPINTLENTYDASGNLKTITDALGKVTTINYPTTNNKGLPDSIKDARLNETELVWNAKNLLQEVEDPYQKKTNYTYDARGRIKTVTNALNHVTTYNYDDDSDRTVEMIYPNSDKITYKYDVRRLIESVTDERGKITTYTFDDAYRLTRITDPLGHFSEYGYDLMSNPTSQTDALGNVTNYKYDDFDRPAEIEYPAAEIGATRLKVNYTYDDLGRIKTLSDTAGRITTYNYLDTQRKNEVINAENEKTMTEYNQRFQTIKVTDAKNQVYNFTYDPLGRMLTQQRAGGTMSYEYDAVGNREKRIDYLGRETSYEYDNLNRLKKINYLQNVANTYPSPTPILTAVYTYDELSRLKTATNEAGTVTLNYDNRNRIKDTTDVFGHLIEYDYTLTSTVNQKSLKFDGALYAQYNFDDADRLTSLIDSNDSTTISFGYDDADKLISKTLPNAVTTTYDYDGMSRLKRLKDTSSTATLFDRQYGYNNASQINQIAEPTQVRTFGYDNVDRLTSMTNGTANESYTFDDVGNRTASHRSASYGYQSGQFNRVASTATANYKYDANGNMVSKSEGGKRLQYVWDYENRLTMAWDRKNRVRYLYDALGRRVQRYIVGGKENTKFIYDGQDVLVDDNNGTLTKYQNGLGIDNKLKMTANGTVNYFLADHLGSTNALTDSSGNVTSSASYDSFGNATGNLTTRYQFTGREFDNFTGLHYYRARWYDGNLGRFISEDPIGLAGGDVNLYGYVGNNPLGATDPSGLDAEYDQQVWRAQQDIIEALAAPIEYGMGFGDEYLVFPRYVRQWQGIDTPNLDCSAAYQAGQWTAFGLDLASGVGAIVKGAGKYVGRKILRRGANELAEEAIEAGGKACLRCFEAGTEVQTDEGLKPIEEIETGDKVLSYNEQTRLLEYREVLAKFTRSADDIYSLRVEGESEPLGVTSEHPFFVRTYYARGSLISGDEEGEWRETQNLQIGDEIKLANGNWAKVLEIKFKGAGQVYNFTVADNHNYFVGNLRLLTHNIECTKLALDTQKKIGGTVYRITPKAGNYLNVPNKLYPGKGMWDYHDVVVKNRMVYDELSKFGKTPIPFEKWWRAWEQGAVTKIKKY